MAAPYKVKEIFYTLQGEGAQSGRPAVFCRFSKCNLWNGREEDRAGAVCQFCDTDITGTDGVNGGVYKTADALIEKICSLWPGNETKHAFVVCTGGEPALQLDQVLVDLLHRAGFEIAIETNGTLPLPDKLDWVCVSPKSTAELVIQECDELKLVFPQHDAPPSRFESIRAKYYYLTPMAQVPAPIPAQATSQSPALVQEESRQLIVPSQDDNTRKTIAYCLQHPNWRLNLQTHKVVGVP